VSSKEKEVENDDSNFKEILNLKFRTFVVCFPTKITHFILEIKILLAKNLFVLNLQEKFGFFKFEINTYLPNFQYHHETEFSYTQWKQFYYKIMTKTKNSDEENETIEKKLDKNYKTLQDSPFPMSQKADISS